MTGFQARSRSGRWSWTLKLAQKRSCAGSWSWASEVGLLSLQVVPRQQCNGHCLCDCPPQQLKQQLRGALVAARQWPLFWRRSFSGGIRGRAFTLSSSPPPPPPTVPNKHPRFCGRKAKWSWSTEAAVRLVKPSLPATGFAFMLLYVHGGEMAY